MRDCPYHLFDAIRLGLQFINWQENLDEDEMPPREIWFSERQLEEHFERVKQVRKEKANVDPDGPGPIEDPVQNDAARGLIAG